MTQVVRQKLPDKAAVGTAIQGFRLDKIKAIGGVRVSTDVQQDRYGPARQRADIEREAARAGLTLTDWVEEAISGADDERAFENRYYELARATPGLHVIFSHPNRVGRHVEVTVGIARRLHKLGGTVWIAGVGNLRDRRNWKEFLRDAVDAENDYTTIIYNLSTGKMDKARLNRWPEGKQPYGYRLVRDESGKSTTLEPHPDHAPVYLRACELALSGLGAFSIAQEFNRLNIPPPRLTTGVRKSPGWNDVHIGRMLKNPRYLGTMVYQGPEGDTVTLTYPPLIDAVQWQQIQDGIQTRKTRRRPVSPFPALMAGHVACAVCGASMTLAVSRNRVGEPNWARYICRTHQSRASRTARGLPDCEHTARHRVPETDAVAWSLLVSALTDPQFLAQTLSKPEDPLPSHAARLAEITQEQAALLTRAARFNLPDGAVELALKPLQEEQERLEREVKPQAAVPSIDAVALAERYSAYLATCQTLEKRRAALHRWGVRFELGAEGFTGLQLAFAEG